LIKAEIIAQSAPDTPTPDGVAKLEALSKALANAIIQHLIASIQVLPGIPVTTNTGGGATTGPGMIT
jgi:hypothetical protein